MRLNLDKHIKIGSDTMLSPNLCDEFSEGDLDAIGNYVYEGYKRDEYSRSDWRRRIQASMDLAMQLQKEKTFPWPTAANIAFPLVTIATLQFHSRAYPAIINGPQIVQYRVYGEDPTGEQRKRANRIGEHMSYQLMEQDASWEEQHDRMLINIPIVGCAFKKSRYSAGKGHPTSDLVMATDLVMDYYAKSVEDCSRKTHVIPMFRNEIREGILRGIYRDVTKEPWYREDAKPVINEDTDKKDDRDGTIPPTPGNEAPYTMLEQHCSIDLDGDGYDEPYIITIESSSHQVVRIVLRFDEMDAVERADGLHGEIIRIKPTEYFTKYGFIPSPDGSVYDIGFGVLLGPLNETVNSLINQLVDAGTMSNLAGGFLGRGAKIRGGVYTFTPFEWKRIDSTVDDLKKAIFPLPVREPSNVLFQLLSLIINYTNRISGSTDTMVGENPGQNTPAQTTQTMVEQGMKIYNAIFKRVWRSMKEEFKKIYNINAVFLPQHGVPFGPDGAKILRQDYKGDPNRISPTADPNITSEHQRLQQAIQLKQLASTTQGYNLEEVELNLLRAMHIDSPRIFYPGPGKVPPLPNPKVMVEEVKAKPKMAQLQMRAQEFAMQLMEDRRLNNAKIIQLEAQAASLIAGANSDQVGHQIAMFEAAIGAYKVHNDALNKQIESFLKLAEQDNEQSSSEPPNGGGVPKLAGPSSNSIGNGNAAPMAGSGT